jgi:iron-sulfur cluster assembly protein/iron-sulfur cluster insertion protein
MQTISITPRGAQPKVTLTATAVAKVAELIAKEGDESLALRLGVRPGGCSGFSYQLELDTTVDADDVVNEFDGVRLVVDAQSIEKVNGAVIDYRDGQDAGFTSTTPTSPAAVAAATRSRRAAARRAPPSG